MLFQNNHVCSVMFLLTIHLPLLCNFCFAIELIFRSLFAQKPQKHRGPPYALFVRFFFLTRRPLKLGILRAVLLILIWTVFPDLFLINELVVLARYPTPFLSHIVENC